MERPRRQGASQDRRQPRKKRRLSPLPSAPPGGAGGRAGVSRPCRRRLFGSVGSPGPQPGSLKGWSGVKSLPKINENLEVSQESRSCNQSNQVNVQKTTDFEKKEEKMEESSVPLKESLVVIFESKESLKNPEVTSSTGMTLPTGVSTFLLQCLDEDSTADCNTGASGSLSSCLSPETFRNNISERSNCYAVDSGKYKNSTLLDSSKAVTIDKIPRISNLSPISERVLEDFQDKYTRRKRPSNCNYSSSLNVSTIVAGKKVCKITATRERTPDLKMGMRCSSPLRPARKRDNQTAEPKWLKCKKRQTKFHAFKEGQPDVSGNTSVRSEGLMAEVPPAKQTDAVVQTSPTLLIMEENEVLKNPDSAKPAERDPLCGRREICSIVRTSPCRRPAILRQTPVSTKAFSIPEGVTEGEVPFFTSQILLSKSENCVQNYPITATESLSGDALCHYECKHTKLLSSLAVDLQDSDSSKHMIAQMLLQERKNGSAINTDEVYGFQQEISTEEITVLLLWQGGETEILTSN